MRFAKFTAAGRTCWGLVEGDRVAETAGEPFGEWERTSRLHQLADVRIEVPPYPILARDEVLPTELDGIEGELPRRDVDEPLHRERGVRPPRPAVGRGRRGVRDHDPPASAEGVARHVRLAQPGKKRRVTPKIALFPVIEGVVMALRAFDL